jgi:hypothetical protein
LLARQHKLEDSLHILHSDQANASLSAHYENKVDKSYLNSINASKKALSEFNLALADTMNKMTERLKIKSVNLPQITLVPAQNGQVGPVYLTHQGDDSILSVKIISVNNTAYNLKLRIGFIGFIKFNISYVGITRMTSDVLTSRSFLVPNTTITESFILPKNLRGYENIYIVMYGSFSSDVEGKMVIPYQQGVEFSIKNNVAIGPIQDEQLTGLVKQVIDSKL